jgi:hypothetical protein
MEDGLSGIGRLFCGWWYGCNGRAPAWQEQGPELKHQYCQKEKKKKKSGFCPPLKQDIKSRKHFFLTFLEVIAERS